MPNWKKVIVSGSDASLNSLIVNHASGSFSGSFEGDGSNLTGVATPTGSFSGSFTGSFSGDGSGLTGISATVVGTTNEITLSANYTTQAGTYNSLFGPLVLASDVTMSVTEGSFLKIENF